MNRSTQTRREFLKTIGLTTTAFSLGGCTESMSQLGKEKNKPNILLILVDDLGGHGESLIHLSGGQILGDLTVYNTTSWIHIFGYGFNNDPFPGSPLTGFWMDSGSSPE